MLYVSLWLFLELLQFTPLLLMYLYDSFVIICARQQSCFAETRCWSGMDNCMSDTLRTFHDWPGKSSTLRLMWLIIFYIQNTSIDINAWILRSEQCLLFIAHRAITLDLACIAAHGEADLQIHYETLAFSDYVSSSSPIAPHSIRYAIQSVRGIA